MSSHRVALAALAILLPLAALADPKDDARKRFVEGVQLARAGQYQEAIELFREADGIFRHPATTYNIAYAYQQLGEFEQAIQWYELLITQAPTRSDEIRGVVDELQARIDAERAAAAAAAAASEPAAAPTQPAAGSLGLEEVERLRAIAAELEKLAVAAAERAPPDPADPPSPSDPDAPSEPPPTDSLPEIEGAGFEMDAYERVVVTASRYGQAPLDSPSTISLITADEIRLSGATSIADVMRRVVGVDVMNMASGQPEISIRGFNRELNNKVLVLIDGRSVYWDFLGSTQWNRLPIVLEEIERIEVIRGPGSAVYGANAVTGVVNIITKTPGENPETIARLDYGSPGYMRGSVFTNGRAGETAWRLSASYTQHERWERTEEITENSSLSPVLENQNLGLQQIQGAGRIDRSFGDLGVVSLSGGFVDGTAEIYNIGVLGNYAMDTTDAYVRADATFGPVHARVFYNYLQGSTGPWAGLPAERRLLDSDFLATTFDAELESFGEFSTGSIDHRINGGIGYRRKYIGNFDYLEGEVVEHHFNAFVNHEASIGKVKLIGSLRADRHPLIDLDRTLSPRGAIIGRVAKDTSLRLTGGTAFRVPTLVESYMDFGLPSGVDGVVVEDFGSRALFPERILTFEAGFHDESSLYHTVDVTVFYNRVSNLIGLRPLDPRFSPYSPRHEGFIVGETGWVNLADVYHGGGVEVDGKLFPADGLDIFANLNVQRIFQDTPGQDLQVDRSTSLIKANAGVQYRTPYRVDLSTAAHFVGPQTWVLRGFDEGGDILFTPRSIPSRFLFNARVAARPFADDKLELAVTGWNMLALADAGRSREHPNGQLLRARIFGSVSYSF
ncbi:MAG: TonB-dependent receptor [Deltaproteobacteria bacterium]|nr:MAG: TonB-dependent receptor [Deltaproteobacteria bacterium]